LENLLVGRDRFVDALGKSSFGFGLFAQITLAPISLAPISLARLTFALLSNWILLHNRWLVGDRRCLSGQNWQSDCWHSNRQRSRCKQRHQSKHQGRVHSADGEGPQSCTRPDSWTKPPNDSATPTRVKIGHGVEAGMALAARLIFLAFLAITANAQVGGADMPPAGDRLLVCNKAENTVSIFAVAKRSEVAVLKTGLGPHEVAVSPDGRMAVVTNYGDTKPGHTLTVIDVVAAKVLRTINLPQPSESPADSNKLFLRPHGVQFVSEHRVIVTSEASRRLVLVNIKTSSIERTWSTPQSTMHMVAATKDGKHAAASSVADGTVVFFDLTEAKSVMPAPIKTGKGAEGLAVHPITGDAWVGNRSDNTLSIVSRQTGKVVKSFDTGAVPFRVAFTADHKLVLVTCAEGGELMIFDAAKRELVREGTMHGDRSEQSSLPLGVVSGPDSRFAYVTCARGEFVAIMDLLTGQLIDRIDARKGPDGIAYARPREAATKR
ncbi:MAG: DNA-binding beta-propeller fold protein YncE, partial [Planctomycetota bacterium]